MRLIDAEELLSEETLTAFPSFAEKLADTTDLRDIVASCKTIRDVSNCYIVKSSLSQEETERLLQIFKKKENCFIAQAEKEADMQVTYNGFTGELVKLERVPRDRAGVPMGMKFGNLTFDLSIYDSEKNVTHSFTGVKLEDVKFLGGAATFGV